MLFLPLSSLSSSCASQSVAISTFGFSSLSFCETNCRAALLPIATVVVATAPQTVRTVQCSIRDTAIKMGSLSEQPLQWLPQLIQCSKLELFFVQHKTVSLGKVHFEQLQTHTCSSNSNRALPQKAHMCSPCPTRVCSFSINQLSAAVATILPESGEQ